MRMILILVILIIMKRLMLNWRPISFSTSVSISFSSVFFSPMILIILFGGTHVNSGVRVRCLSDGRPACGNALVCNSFTERERGKRCGDDDDVMGWGVVDNVNRK